MKRRVLVTGSSRGIGFAVATVFKEAGHEVILNSGHDRERLTSACRVLKSRGYFCDVSDYQRTAEMFGEIEADGAIEILVNCAGISHVGLFSDMSLNDITNVVGINLQGVINCCHLAVPKMVARKWGRIINISSIWGSTGASCEVVYSAAKGGVNAFSKALGKELAPSGITVNAVACGVIDTDMNAAFSDSELYDLYGRIPASRPGTPEEVASLCVYLASPTAGYINGQVITIDGAFS